MSILFLIFGQGVSQMSRVTLNSLHSPGWLWASNSFTLIFWGAGIQTWLQDRTSFRLTLPLLEACTCSYHYWIISVSCIFSLHLWIKPCQWGTLWRTLTKLQEPPFVFSSHCLISSLAFISNNIRKSHIDICFLCSVTGETQELYFLD